MAEWIDLALIGDEAALSAAVGALDGDGQARALKSLTRALAIGEGEVVENLIRLLVERVRPLALPASLWSRPVTASDDPLTHVRNHFRRRGINETQARLDAAVRLYDRFAEERVDRRVGEAELTRCGFRCQHCGIAFCNEQLEYKGVVSPFGNRGRDKSDPLKPHWNGGAEKRQPTHDHVWPVSTYGDNSSDNLRVLCNGCNFGKGDVLALEQVRAWTGLTGRDPLLRSGVVDWAAFYAQLRQSPRCDASDAGPNEAELTVELVDPGGPPVLGNLRTVTSKGV